MPRSIWNGTIKFGLVTVPVKVHSATEDHRVHFHQVHAKDGARIKQKRLCSKEHKEVPYGEVVKGYEVADGEYVVLTKDEIAAAAGEADHFITLEEFVCATAIDPVFCDKSYYLGVGKDGEKPYRLLHDALSKAERAGIGRWVFHNREYLVAVRSLGGVLVLHTMRFAAELVEPADLDVPSPSRAPAPREVEMAGKLVDSLHAAFAAEDFEDSYRQRVLELIAAKARGEEPPPPEPQAESGQVDLAAALEASLAPSGGGSKRPSRSRR